MASQSHRRNSHAWLQPTTVSIFLSSIKYPVPFTPGHNFVNFVSFPFLFGSHVLERMPSRMCLSPRRLIRILRGRSVSPFLFSLRSFGREGGTHKSMTQHERIGGVCFFTNIPGAYGTMDGGSPCGWEGERRGGTYRVGGIIYMHCLRLGSPALFERGAVEQHITLNNTHLDCCCCVDDGCGLWMGAVCEDGCGWS